MEGGQADRRVRRTKGRLQKSLAALLREKEVRDVTVKELAALADVSRGTFYCHYRDIYDMVEQMENEMFEELSGLLNAYLSEQLRKEAKPLLEDIFRFIGENADLCAALLGAERGSSFLERLKTMVYEKVAHDWAELFGFLPGDAMHDYTLTFLVGGVVGLVQSWLAGGCRVPAGEMAGLAEALILYGVKRPDQ